MSRIGALALAIGCALAAILAVGCVTPFPDQGPYTMQIEAGLEPAVAEARDRWFTASGVEIPGLVVRWGECSTPQSGGCHRKRIGRPDLITITDRAKPDQVNVTVLHEFGHALGLKEHEDDTLMAALLSRSTRCITARDLTRLCSTKVCAHFAPEC